MLKYGHGKYTWGLSNDEYAYRILHPRRNRTRKHICMHIPLILLAMLCEQSNTAIGPLFARNICEHLRVLCERGLIWSVRVNGQLYDSIYSGLRVIRIKPQNKQQPKHPQIFGENYQRKHHAAHILDPVHTGRGGAGKCCLQKMEPFVVNGSVHTALLATSKDLPTNLHANLLTRPV